MYIDEHLKQEWKERGERFALATPPPDLPYQQKEQLNECLHEIKEGRKLGFSPLDVIKVKLEKIREAKAAEKAEADKQRREARLKKWAHQTKPYSEKSSDLSVATTSQNKQPTYTAKNSAKRATRNTNKPI